MWVPPESKLHNDAGSWHRIAPNAHVPCSGLFDPGDLPRTPVFNLPSPHGLSNSHPSRAKFGACYVG
jgi:hypothetical protein